MATKKTNKTPDKVKVPKSTMKAIDAAKNVLRKDSAPKVTEQFKEMVKEAVAEAKTEAAKEVAEKKEPVKKPAPKTAATAEKKRAPKKTATTEKKETAKKAASTTKKTDTASKLTRTAIKEKRVDKAVEKASSLANVTLQFGETETTYEAICDNAKKAWSEAGGTGAIKTLDVYVKPEEGKAYYVINDETGSIDI